MSSFTSLSSSLCSQYSSCVDAGSTGVYTITATAGTDGFGDGPFGEHGGGGGGGPFGGPFAWSSGSHWPSTGATTTITTTGCPWATGGWFGNGGGGDGDGGEWGGWGGWGGGGGIWGGGGFWGSSQTGWAYRTATTTVTTTFTSVGNLVTATGIATVEMAVSGRRTSTTTFFSAKATGNAGSGSNGASSSSGSGPARPLLHGAGGGGGSGLTLVKVTGLLLGTLMAVVGML
ncbi:hypothetical protein SEPCBS57363_005567 [Sporothrix epigloea]|uniref:Uncharacterized protein n=1 Tax=Sporothrix epigloea TaxID=1892477 RepID=A0ABP0DY87_9PEZI